MKQKSIFDKPATKTAVSIFGAPVKKSEAVPDVVVANKRSNIFDSPVVKQEVKKGQVSLLSTGTIRKRINVTDADLQKYSSDASTVSQAIKLIQQTNLDDLKLEYVMSIGQHEQEKHATLVKEILELSSDASVATCQNKLIELIELLEKSDNENGWFESIKFFREKKQDAFKSNMNVINAISQELSLLLPNLQMLMHSCDKKMLNVRELHKLIQPIIVQCSFFSEYQKDEFPSHLFLSRLTGLMGTQSTLKINEIQVDTLKKTIIDLVDTISQVVLTDLPLWISSCTNTTLKQTIVNKLKNKQHHV